MDPGAVVARQRRRRRNSAAKLRGVRSWRLGASWFSADDPGREFVVFAHKIDGKGRLAYLLKGRTIRIATGATYP